MPPNRQKFSIKRIIPSRLFLLIGVVILILFSVSLSKEVIRRYEVNREIRELEKEVAELEKQNTELTQLEQFLNTERFQEQEARLKLGLAKPGEKVIVIPGVSEEKLPKEELSAPSNNEELSNPHKWWNYFFSQ